MTKKKCLGCQWKHCPPPNMFMFKCLLNQGSKALEPPRTHQARVEWGCYCCTSSTSPHQKNTFADQLFQSHFGHLIFVGRRLFFRMTHACFVSHVQKVQSFLHEHRPKSPWHFFMLPEKNILWPGCPQQVPGFPPLSRVADGSTFGLPPLNLADCWGWRT